MHSITESDGVPSDPYEVLCHMAALIIEGRTPLHITDGIVAFGAPGNEAVGKPAKPYREGPHCPNFMKLYNKEPSNSHKCGENVLCLRFGKLKQHLHHLYEKSVPICVEVSLGPDCLCGELRSQSTLVSGTPSKRDIVLEQWTININSKRGHEASSQMSVMNLYQAVRSLLHFSQLTAWYMRNNGMKPANIIYRVGVPGDSTFANRDNFIKHEFPVADINKGISIKMSVSSIPRIENIPSVYCPQHSCGNVESESGIHHQDGREFSRLNKEKKFLGHGIASKLAIEERDQLADSNLPLKFQGVRKKIYKSQERKGKNRIAYFGASQSYGVGSSRSELCDGLEYVDAIAVEKSSSPGKSVVGVYANGKPFPCESLKSRNLPCESAIADLALGKTPQFPGDLLKPFDEAYSCNFFEQEYVQQSMDGVTPVKSYCNSDVDCHLSWTADKSDDSLLERFANQKFETAAANPEKELDIVDDRMQISCGISGKHHCKCEYEEEVESVSVEKPRRRRSVGKGRPSEKAEDFAAAAAAAAGSDADKILHGKFKEIHFAAKREESCKPPRAQQEPCAAAVKTTKRSMQNESFKWIVSDLPVKKKSLKSLTEAEPEGSDRGRSLPTSSAGSADAAAAPLPHVTSLPPAENEMDSPSELDSDSSASDDDDDDDEAWKMEKAAGLEPERGEAALVAEDAESSKCGREKGDSTEDGVEVSDDDFESASNPFLAAILRTGRKTRKTAESHEANDTSPPATCDNSQDNLYNSDVDANAEFDKINNCDYPVDKKIDKKDKILHRLNRNGKPEVTEKRSDTKTKVVVPRGSADSIQGMKVSAELLRRSPMRCRHRVNLDLRLEQKKASAVRNLSDFGSCPPGPSEFFAKNLNRLRSLFDGRDFGAESEARSSGTGRCKVDFDGEDVGGSGANGAKTISVPSAQEKLKFRRSLDSAAQLVFHRCSGLPLTSSPAPVRRNHSSFSFDSSLNSVSAIKSALFDSLNSVSSEDENESEGSLRSPASPGAWSIGSKSINYHSLSPLPLLGTFEESVLNGRLEPVSTVQGFTAELGASGSFCPRHLYLPVTVFFYTLGDNDKVSAPYLGHINLGKKGYNVPRSGTIQVTLFNPLRTVVKMFVVLYDLHDMPPNSHTFLRQRTLYVPANQKESVYFDKKDVPFDQEDYHKYLRYLIHLRFVSGKTGRIYLHTDIRMVIFRKADEDTATALGKKVDGETFELRSHTHGPTNPKFSPRK